MTPRSLILLLLLSLGGTLGLRAYNDHRNRHVDSLEVVLQTCPPADASSLIRIYDGLAWGYLETNEQRSTHYADLAIPLCAQQRDYLHLNNFHRIKGMHHWGNARYDEAEQEFTLALDAVQQMRSSGKYTESDIDDQESALLGTMGNLYNTLGQGAKALQYYYNALRLFQKYDWRESQSLALCNMGELYLCMGNLERAARHYQQADSIARLTADSLMQCYVHRGLAKVELQQDRYEQAWQHVDFVHQYAFAHPDEEGATQSQCLAIMTDIAIAQNDWQHVQSLLLQQEQLGPERYQNNAAYYCQRAQLMAHQGRWQEAETLARQALDIDDEAQDQVRETYRLLADILYHLGRYEQAQVFTTKADSIQTSWANYAYQASLTEEVARYEAKSPRSASSPSSKPSTASLLIGVLALLAGIGAFGVLLRRQYHKQRSRIASQVALETETRERQFIAQDLHDGLGGMLSLLKMKIADQDHDAAMQLVDESSREMRRVAHHIMPQELERSGLVASLQNFAASTPGAYFQHVCAPDVDTSVRLPQDKEITLYRCAYELVNNAIRHAAASHIMLQLLTEQQSVTLTVSDDGCGFSPQQPSDGMGLSNIRKRIQSFGGQMHIISLPGNGTEINITMPL